MRSSANEIIYEDVQTQAQIAELQTGVEQAHAQAPVTPAIGSGQFIVGTRASRAFVVGQQLYAEYFETDTKLRYYWKGTGWLYSGGEGVGTDASKPAVTANDNGAMWKSTDTREHWHVAGGAWVRTFPRNNYAAVTAPGVGNDTTQGYAAGSTWIDLTLDDGYVCVDASAGAAIWKKTTP